MNNINQFTAINPSYPTLGSIPTSQTTSPPCESIAANLKYVEANLAECHAIVNALNQSVGVQESACKDMDSPKPAGVGGQVHTCHTSTAMLVSRLRRILDAIGG